MQNGSQVFITCSERYRGISKYMLGLWCQECDWDITMRPRQNGHRLPDDIFKCIFLNEKVWISIKISLKLVPKGSINYINYTPALVQIMAWRHPGDKSLAEPMMVSLLIPLCITRPQWDKVNSLNYITPVIYGVMCYQMIHISSDDH